jgi:putative nucleotidyltransferase with HDIG domain
VIGFSDSVNQVLNRVRAALPTDVSVYLVGGSVRDLLLGREINDLDFALSGNVLSIARRLGNDLGAAYFPLDAERQTARLVLGLPDSKRMKLDFAGLRGPDLESDLLGRDFTINAMALPLVDSPELVDPLGGAVDLRSKVLRACSDTAFLDDPVRVLRSVRLATAFGFRIKPETSRQIRQAVPLLVSASPERLRDELFRMLEGVQPATSIRLLDVLGALGYVLPELVVLKGIAQSPPHISDVWNHTLDVIQRLDQVLAVLAADFDQEKAANWALGFISIQLGRFRGQFSAHLAESLNLDRSLRGLLFLAALYHDVGKPITHSEDENGRTRFYEHEQVSAELAVERAHQFRLSNDEIERLSIIVRHHMRPMLLAQSAAPPTRKAIYRYFRATGSAGVDIGLLSLADALATYGPTLPREIWTQQLGVIRTLYEAWWERPEQAVTPPTLVNGYDLMKIFDLEPGPQIGRLLEAIREAQAVGQVCTREQALILAREALEHDGQDDWVF